MVISMERYFLSRIDSVHRITSGVSWNIIAHFFTSLSCKNYSNTNMKLRKKDSIKLSSLSDTESELLIFFLSIRFFCPFNQS